MTTMISATTADEAATKQRRQFLLGLAARYPEIRESARAGDGLHETFAPLELDGTDIAMLASFADREIEEAEQRIHEDFAEVYQYGI